MSSRSQLSSQARTSILRIRVADRCFCRTAVRPPHMGPPPFGLRSDSAGNDYYEPHGLTPNTIAGLVLSVAISATFWAGVAWGVARIW
jgi:hypothetical protein